VLHASWALADAWATALFAAGDRQGLVMADRERLAALFQYRDTAPQLSSRLKGWLAWQSRPSSMPAGLGFPGSISGAQIGVCGVDARDVSGLYRIAGAKLRIAEPSPGNSASSWWMIRLAVLSSP